ncbi:IL17C protein, partial [Polyodon spathula]|nr:IL17C protein [Polyodon spathula]
MASLEDMSECRHEIPHHILEKRLKTNRNPVLWGKTRPAKHHCPEWSPSLLASSNVHDRSLSPWAYRINVELGRFPEIIFEAYCLCDGCLDWRDLKFTLNFSSVPVTRTEKVYRIEPCGNGKFKYVPEWIEVAIACTCVAPKGATSKKMNHLNKAL